MGNRKIIFLQLSKKAFTKQKKYATITRLASSAQYCSVCVRKRIIKNSLACSAVLYGSHKEKSLYVLSSKNKITDD